jgi:hypothetical protein
MSELGDWKTSLIASEFKITHLKSINYRKLSFQKARPRIEILVYSYNYFFHAVA